MATVLRVIGFIVAALGISSGSVAAIIVGIILFGVGFWMTSATRDYLNNNRK